VGDDAAADVAGAFELVIANIQADVLEALRDALVARLAPGGALVLSGLLAEQAEPVAARYEQAGLARRRITTLDEDREWSAALLERRR
jgi:ribosomal protein L11 methyltransferase